MDKASKVKEILQQSRDLISNPENWTSSTAARDSHYKSVRHSDQTACMWCATGAVAHIATLTEGACVNEGKNFFDVFNATIKHLARTIKEDKFVRAIYDDFQDLLADELGDDFKKEKVEDINPSEIVEVFNDTLTHEDVLTLFDIAIERLEKQQQGDENRE